MRATALLTVTGALLLTAGCSTGSHHYSSATELRSAAVNAGLHCTGYNPAAPPQGAASAGTCVGGTPAQFVVYDDDAAAKRGIEAAKIARAKGQAVLSGPNWYLVSDASSVDGVKDAVGGDVSK